MDDVGRYRAVSVRRSCTCGPPHVRQKSAILPLFLFSFSRDADEDARNHDLTTEILPSHLSSTHRFQKAPVSLRMKNSAAQLSLAHRRYIVFSAASAGILIEDGRQRRCWDELGVQPAPGRYATPLSHWQHDDEPEQGVDQTRY